jgi:hypothetical protein
MGVPMFVNGPFINRRPCSSFYAEQTVNVPAHVHRVRFGLMTTGRAQQFGGFPLDREYQGAFLLRRSALELCQPINK